MNKFAPLILLLLCGKQACSLECSAPSLKVTVKITDPTEFDEYEQYLFKGTLAYSVRKYCGTLDSCPVGASETEIADVELFDETDRFAMCVKVNGLSQNEIEESIRYSKPRFHGALELDDDTLVVQGIPPTLTPETEPAFPIWLIPYIVIICLVVLAAVAIIAYTVYQSKKEKTKFEFDDEENKTYENEAFYEIPNAATAL